MRAAVGGLVVLGVVAGPAPSLAAFERPPVGPAEAAVGGVLAVGEDPVFGNPALVAGARAGLVTWVARPFGLRELEESQAGVWAGGGLRSGAVAGVGIGVRRFGSSAWSEREGRLVLGVAPAPGIAVAVALRGLEAGGSGVAPHRSMAVDLAFRVRAGPAEIGAVAEAVVGEVPGDPQGLHRRSAVGLVRSVGPARVLLEIQRVESRPPAVVLGTSLALPAGLVLRAGLRQDPARVTWGFGLRVGPLRADVAAAEGGPLGRTVRVGLRAAAGSGARH